MKKCYAIFILMFLLSPFLAQAIMCEKLITQNCTMLTPTLTGCDTYNYTIINYTGSEVQAGDLTNLYEDIYYLNVTMDPGQYLVTLCDNSTREIWLYEGEMFSAIVFIMIGAALGLLFLAFLLKDDHAPIKLLLVIVSVFLLIATLGLNQGILTGDLTQLTTITSGAYKAVMLSGIVIIAYFIVYFLVRVLESIRLKNRE